MKLKTDGILPGSVMEKLAQRVKRGVSTCPSLPEVTCAASLAHKGILGAVDYFTLDDINLVSIPARHLVSLVSSATGIVDIQDVRSGLVTILDNVRCEKLCIDIQSLGTEETEALVQAMETRVGEVVLGDVTLEMETLSKYSGHGKCNKVISLGRFREEIRGKLRSWATTKDWKVKVSSYHGTCLQIKRN